MPVLNGNNLNNTLTAWNSWDDFDIYGFGGDDALIAFNGDDYLFGGSGNDTLIGGFGWNFLDGGTGYDTADYSFFSTSSSLGMHINLAAGVAYDRLTGGGLVDDRLRSIEGAVGSSKADVIIGSSGDNILEGMSGDDSLNGGAGSDDLFGSRGADMLTGGSGFDFFVFESINDSNSFHGRDTITDFQRGIDKIDLFAIDARTGSAGNNAFSWIGYDTTFNGNQGELHYWHFWSGGAQKTVVEGDINGDRVADFQIYLNGFKTLGSGDFIL